MNRYRLYVSRVIDGDTVVGDLIAHDIGIIIPDQKFRLMGCDTPERGEVHFYEATEFTAFHTENLTVDITLHGKDSFGRWLADVYVGDKYDSLSKLLIDEGLATIYED